MMFGIADEVFTNGVFGHDLFRGDPGAMSVWQAIGRYNRFFADNEEYYVGAASVASLAIILDDRGDGVELLNGLSSRNVLYDVLYERDVTPKELKPYAAVALLTAKMVRDRAVKTLEKYLAGGGKVVAAGAVATQDETGSPRSQPSFLHTNVGKSGCLYFDKLPGIDELARTLLEVDRRPLVNVVAPKGVLYNVVVQPKTGRVIVHLLNYTAQPVRNIKVMVKSAVEQATLLSPDSSRNPVRILPFSMGMTEIDAPELATYSLLVLEPK
jgi:hypothetical protein